MEEVLWKLGLDEFSLFNELVVVCADFIMHFLVSQEEVTARKLVKIKEEINETD